MKFTQKEIRTINKAFLVLSNREVVLITNRIIFNEDIYSTNNILRQYKQLKSTAKLLAINIKDLIKVIQTTFDRELVLTSPDPILVLLGQFKKDEWKNLVEYKLEASYNTNCTYTIGNTSFIVHKEQEQLGVVKWR